MIETERLRIYPASKEEMKDFISRQANDILKTAYQEMLDGCLMHPEEWNYYAIWMIEKRMEPTLENAVLRVFLLMVQRRSVTVFRKSTGDGTMQPKRSMLLLSGRCSSIKFAAWRQRQKPATLHQYGCFKSADSSLPERLVRKVPGLERYGGSASHE